MTLPSASTRAAEPIYATCADWKDVLFGAQVAPHETMHLLGIHDEGVAECFGMQNLAYWVWKLSGDTDFAEEASQDYWAWYQANRTGTEYGHPACYAGGSLDLDPSTPEWPTLVRASITRLPRADPARRRDRPASVISKPGFTPSARGHYSHLSPWGIPRD